MPTRTFESATEIDIARKYVEDQALNGPLSWKALLLWTEGKSERLKAVLEHNPPLSFLAGYLQGGRYSDIKPTMLVRIIEYGKSDLLEYFVKRLQQSSQSENHNPSWLFSNFPSASTPTVRRTLVKYTSEAVASSNGQLLMVPSLHAHNLDWISEIALNTPRTFEQTQDVVLEIARAAKKHEKLQKNLHLSVARNNLKIMFEQLSDEQKQKILNHTQSVNVNLLACIEQKQTISAPTKVTPISQATPVAPELDLYQVRAMFNKPRLSDTMVDAIIHNSTPKLKDNRNRTLLERIVLQGLVSSFDKAVKAGGDVFQTNVRGENLAHKAGHSKRKKMLEVVIEAGVNPWAPDQYGHTTLHKIALSSPNMIEILCKHPLANPNAVDNTGSTALFYLFPQIANWDKRVLALKSVNILLKMGVDPNIRNKQGQTFLDVARSRFKTPDSKALVTTLEETVVRFQNYKLAVALDDVVGEPISQNKKRM